MPRSSRLAIWCIALLLSLSLCIKGRAPAGKGEGAAFLRPAPGMVKVRLAGDFRGAGLYLFPDGTTIATAIKMTVPGARIIDGMGSDPERRIASGDVVTLRGEGKEFLVLSLGKMGVKEKMLLRIALDPDQLSAEEWCCLPGIGPALSARIVTDRQKYGAFGSLDGLQRVPGIGPGTLAALRRYF